jgi:cation diffusion facilitator CzcD-associated flavoprotein CzcO
MIQSLIYQLSRRRPRAIKQFIRKGVERSLPAGYDIDKHFKPKYNPWDQRMCLVPNGDLFKAIRDGDATVVTDTIERFTENGIKLDSGEQLEADVIITATGLSLQFLGAVELKVDGEEPDIASAMTYKGMMLSDIPNLAFTLGYSNASWTLKVDLTSEYMCRLLNHMDEHGYRLCVPRVSDPTVTIEPLIGLNSNYILRSLEHLPKQGSKEPWKLRQNYPIDLRALRYGSVVDGAMQFSSPPGGPPLEPEPVAVEAA